MINTILGSKVKMSQTFIEGSRIPVTVIKAGPCVVTQIKTQEKDGYWAIQLGYMSKGITHITKPLQGHMRGVIKNKKAPLFLREIRTDKDLGLKVGDEVSISQIFKRGDQVTITGTSKSKGFAGVVKRWGFAGGPRTHGQSDRERAPGSIGQGTTPGRIWKGKKMAGRMGGETITVRNLIVTNVYADKNMIEVSGTIPGHNSSILIIAKTGSGKLKELIHETPQIQVQEEEGEAKPEKNETKEEKDTKE